jgi:ATPase subunit of ABC transporter with duplicated ATPase domains
MDGKQYDSHDRWFLDRVVTRIIELKNGQLKSYSGNYSAFLKAKKLDEEAEKIKKELNQAYEEWERLLEELHHSQEETGG